MPAHTLTGNIERHPGFPSKVLGNTREVLVYLPPGYRRARTRRFPVLYMQDGQNVFDAATSFGGVEWGIDETAQRLVNQKLMDPTIIVAVANVGEARIHEYAPTRGRLQEGKRKRSKGLLRHYGSFLINELKPFIDARYRTLTEPQHTGLGGSSLGGLATICLGLWFPNVFRRLAVMSPSIWWDNAALLKMVEEIDEEARPPLKIWLDTGTHEEGWHRAPHSARRLDRERLAPSRRPALLRGRRRGPHRSRLGPSHRCCPAVPVSAAAADHCAAAPSPHACARGAETRRRRLTLRAIWP